MTDYLFMFLFIFVVCIVSGVLVSLRHAITAKPLKQEPPRHIKSSWPESGKMCVRWSDGTIELFDVLEMPKIEIGKTFVPLKNPITGLVTGTEEVTATFHFDPPSKNRIDSLN